MAFFYAMTEEQSKGAQLKSMTKRVVSLLLALILALGLLPAGVGCGRDRGF